jgi:tRNA dimethylallyltransferase
LIIEQGLALPNNPGNPRHLIRTLETGGATAERHELRAHTVLLGIDITTEQLEENIRHRVDAMFDAGLIGELAALSRRYGWEAPGLRVPGVYAARAYLDGAMNLEEAKQLFVTGHLQFAKRQKTWFKRNKNISWISKLEEAVDLITSLLNK